MVCFMFGHPRREVLGDRRRGFTWSGSIIDSVVGAFLTQARFASIPCDMHLGCYVQEHTKGSQLGDFNF